LLFPLFALHCLSCAASTGGAFPPEVPAAPAGPQLAPAQQAIADQLDAAAQAARADPVSPVVGLAVKVVSGGTTLLERGYGSLDLDGQQAMPAGAIFRIGSITKQFTAAAILQLEEQGKLKLDDPIGEYLPALKDLSQPIAQVTLQQLLTHTSGVRSFTELPWYESHRNQALSHSDVLAAFAELPLAFEPGAGFSYSNSGYYLLGWVVEQVSGQSYAEYLRQHVFAPAGLVDTRYCPDAQDYPRATPGYERYTGLLRPAIAISMTLPFAAGALCSSTSDLVRWAQALASGKVIPPRSFSRMSSATALKGGQRSPYGFGLSLDELDGHACLDHGGSIAGFASMLSYYPDADLYIAVLANTGSPVPGGLSEQLARIVLRIPEAQPKDLPVAEAEAQPLLGTYQISELGQTLLVVWRDGALRLGPAQAPGKNFRLRAQGGGVYLVPELKASIRFEREAGQARALLVHQQGHDVRGERVPDGAASGAVQP
jgi:CubicO group peptidase (beta-lactamase class C family)